MLIPSIAQPSPRLVAASRAMASRAAVCSVLLRRVMR